MINLGRTPRDRERRRARNVLRNPLLSVHTWFEQHQITTVTHL
jgi:hypothetical protein